MKTVIVDIDGTVALHPNRGHHDYHLVSTDIPNLPVCDLVRNLVGRYVIIYVSGRPLSCREDTENWIMNNSLPLGPLYMRRTGDYRPDNIVKKEIYDNHIAGRYDIAFALDDRDRVVSMWRELGITCLQVAEGNF